MTERKPGKNEDLRIDTTPEQLARAIMSGGAARKEPEAEPKNDDEKER